MRKLKIQQLGLTLCAFALTLFGPLQSNVICNAFFGEPEFPEEV